MIKNNKNYSAVETILASIPDDMTMTDIDMLWCLVVIKRNHGNRTKSAKLLGVAIRTLKTYLGMVKQQGFDVPLSDSKFNSRWGELKKNEQQKDLDRYRTDSKK